MWFRRLSGKSIAIFPSVLLMAAFAMGLAAPAAAEGNGLADIVRGGRLYDNWYKETGAPPPTKSHPAYPATGKMADDAKTNWRCKECHGWDYLGKDGAYGTGRHGTGITGIAAMAGADTAEIIAVLKDDTHAFRKELFPYNHTKSPRSREDILKALKDKTYRERGWMAEKDYRNLAAFIAKGQIDMDRYIDRETKKAKGNRDKGEVYYATICTTCHGRDGLKIKTMHPLGVVANDNPWESLHNILNGHPGKTMPPLRVLGMEIVPDILAFAQSLPREEILSSIVRGGRLYDDWRKETGRTPPEKSFLDRLSDTVFQATPKNNWRCKECHGWDYLGKDGAYGSGRHYTGIKGIDDMAGADPDEVFETLKFGVHDYLGVLTNGDLRDLANFVSRGQVDMDAYIDRATGRAKGDGARNRDYYDSICANCHGDDGREIITMRPLGDISRRNPWESFHKILNGHPERNMPALRALDMQVLVDILAYIQSLPDER